VLDAIFARRDMAVNLDGFGNLARLNLTSNFIASLILDLQASLNLTRVESTSKFKSAFKIRF